MEDFAAKSGRANEETAVRSTLAEAHAPADTEQVESTAPASGTRRIVFGAVVMGLAMVGLALATWHFLSPRSSPINAALTGEALPAVPRPQRLPTLEPTQFSGRAAEAYSVARARPALLERLPCYCGCFTQLGHQNLLDCFADTHAAHCEMCQNITLRAALLALRGYAPEDVKAIIDREFAPRKSTP